MRFTLRSQPFSDLSPGRTAALCVNLYVSLEDNRRCPGFYLFNLEYSYLGNQYTVLAMVPVGPGPAPPSLRYTHAVRPQLGICGCDMGL